MTAAATTRQARVVSYTIYQSSNSYLGIVLASRELAGLPVIHERRPIFVPRSRGVLVADLVGGRESHIKSSYHREDCARWAKRCGIPLRFTEPGEFERRAARWAELPFEREELPARAYYAARAMGRGDELDRCLFESAWIRLEDVNEEATIRAAAIGAQIDPEELLLAARGEQPGRLARESLQAFDESSCPGVPTFVFDGQRFWGKDRVTEVASEIRESLA